MKYTTPPKELFIQNRQRFRELLPPGSAAVGFANSLFLSNADGHYKFTQNSNLYHLTGLDQEDIILWIFPDAPEADEREIIFIAKPDPKVEQWEGKKLTHEDVKNITGVETVKNLSKFEEHLYKNLYLIDAFFLDFNEHERVRMYTPTAAHRFAHRLQEQYPGHRIARAAPLLAQIRMIKLPMEIEQLKKACDITHKALERVLRFVRPGVYEYEIEAEVLHEFIRNGATGPAYESIIATGGNACALHYIKNGDVCQDGDLVLMDFGAEYGNYSSDLTRTIPVNGKFSERQKVLYNTVLEVMRFAKSKLVVGNKLEDYTREVKAVMADRLRALGLLTDEHFEKATREEPACHKYLMHGISHHLGLDTHDVLHRYVPFAPGMVLTCEPGIYIPEEKIGIRIENDILITENGPVDLMEDIPIEADHIEELMLQGR